MCHSFVENNTLHIVTDYADQGDLNTKIVDKASSLYRIQHTHHTV